MWQSYKDPVYNQTTYLAPEELRSNPGEFDLFIPLLGILYGKKGFEYGGYNQQFIIHAIREGSATYQVNGRKFIKKKGDLFVTFPGSRVHCRDNSDTDPLQYMWITFSGSRSAWALKRSGITPEQPLLTGGFDHKQQRLWSELHRDFMTGTPDTVRNVAWAWEFIRALGPVSAPAETIPAGPGRLGTTLDYILRGSMLQKLTVTALAEQLGMNRSTLYRTFKSHFNISPKEYLDNARLEYAIELLRDSMLTGKEIAFQCGFADAGHFNRAFRARQGITPGKWRKRINTN